MREVQERARLTRRLEKKWLQWLSDDGDWNLVGAGCVARQNEGNAVFRLQSFRAPRLPPLIRLDVRSVEDAPVE